MVRIIKKETLKNVMDEKTGEFIFKKWYHEIIYHDTQKIFIVEEHEIYDKKIHIAKETGEFIEKNIDKIYFSGNHIFFRKEKNFYKINKSKNIINIINITQEKNISDISVFDDTIIAEITDEKKQKKYTIFNKEMKKEITKERYNYIYKSKYGYIAIKNIYFLFLDEKAKIISEPFEYAEDFDCNDRAIVGKLFNVFNEKSETIKIKFNIINPHGQILLDKFYDEIQTNNKFYILKDGIKKNIADINGNIYRNPNGKIVDYDEVIEADKKYIIVSNSNKYKLFSIEDFKEISDYYDEIEPLKIMKTKSFFIVRKGEKYNMINQYGREIFKKWFCFKPNEVFLQSI